MCKILANGVCVVCGQAVPQGIPHKCVGARSVDLVSNRFVVAPSDTLANKVEQLEARVTRLEKCNAREVPASEGASDAG